MLKNAAKSEKNLEQREISFEKNEEKLDEEFQLAKRMLHDANNSLKSAIRTTDMIGVKVASELLDSSQKKMDKQQK